MRLTITPLRMAALVATALAVGGCKGEAPKPDVPRATPSDYQSRLNDPNVSEQEKEMIRKSMSPAQGGSQDQTGGQNSGGAPGAG